MIIPGALRLPWRQSWQLKGSFFMVSVVTSPVQASRTETWCYNNDCSKAPRFSSIIHQGFACLLCWGWFIINMIPHLQTRDPGPTFQNLQFLTNAFFSFCYKLLHCSSHLNSFPWSEGSAMYGLWKMETCIVNTFYLQIHFCSFQTFSSRLWLWL